MEPELQNARGSIVPNYSLSRRTANGSQQRGARRRELHPTCFTGNPVALAVGQKDSITGEQPAVGLSFLGLLIEFLSLMQGDGYKVYFKHLFIKAELLWNFCSKMHLTAKK